MDYVQVMRKQQAMIHRTIDLKEGGGGGGGKEGGREEEGGREGGGREGRRADAGIAL